MGNNESNYSFYKEQVTSDIQSCLSKMCCQPILFVGSGLSRRYFSGPSWEELLLKLASDCPIAKDYAYYKQTLLSLPAIGEALAKVYHEWAWNSGRSIFPDHLFNAETSISDFIKHRDSELIQAITPVEDLSIENKQHRREIDLLRKISPHNIITTNYDKFIENIFHDYVPIIGQRIIRSQMASIGEIFKIHGCVSDPPSLVFSKSDYDKFVIKRKYISAKLFTYFLEHPILFIGYSAGDPNIRAILSDVDEALTDEDKVADNIFILEWKNSISEDEYPAREKVLSTDLNKTLRVQAIIADDFDWVFDAFGSTKSISAIPTRILRALLARSHDLVRSDKSVIEVNFEMLEHAVETRENFHNLLGIGLVSNPSSLSAIYPYTITQLNSKLFPQLIKKSHSKANALIKKANTILGLDIKASDNDYHVAIKVGAAKDSISHKYSEKSFLILSDARDGKLESRGAVSVPRQSPLLLA